MKLLLTSIRQYHLLFESLDAVGSAEFVLEPGTSVKFPTGLSVPGCSDSLVLLGTGLLLIANLLCI